MPYWLQLVFLFFFFLYFQFLLLCTLWKIKNVCFSKSLQFCWRSLPFVTEFLSTLDNKRKEESLCLCLCVCTCGAKINCCPEQSLLNLTWCVPAQFLSASQNWLYSLITSLGTMRHLWSFDVTVRGTISWVPDTPDPAYPSHLCWSLSTGKFIPQDLYSQRIHSTCSAWMQPFGWIQQPQHPQLTHSLGGWKELHPPDSGHIQRQGGCPEQGLLLLSPFQKEETFV